jgi:hypothetical protein
MDEDEIMIEDDAIALEDTEDSVAEDVDVSNIIPYVMERYKRAEDYRYQDEERWLRAYRNYRGLYGPDVQFTGLLRMVKLLMFSLLIISFLFLLSLQHSLKVC